MRRLHTGLLLLAACAGDDDLPLHTDPPDVDVVSALAPGEVRAGVVTDPAALWGGVFSEGRPGDVKIYNDRVRFVIQAVRDGSYIIPQGGGVLDADIVRPDGQLGRDLVKDWHPIAGVARVVDPTSVTVVADGSDGEAAIIKVDGGEIGLGFIEGNIETPGFIAPLGLHFEHTYRLEPDAWLLEVTTTVTAGADPVSVDLGDLLMGSPEAAWRFLDGGGLDGTAASFRWSAYIGHAHDAAIAVLAPDGATYTSGAFQALASLADLAGGFAAKADLQPGGSTSWTRYYGVGPDLATLSDAWLDRTGVDTETVDGVVTADDGPVPGAWVAVKVDGLPYTVAVTKGDGSFSAKVPVGATTTTTAIGRATGRFLDMPEGAAPIGPNTQPDVLALQLAGLADGAVPVPLAEGRGVGTADAPLHLGVPAHLTVRTGDDLPFTVRVQPTEADVVVDETIVPERPDDLAAAGWSRDGELELLLEPGTYDVVVHRGIRWELHEERVTIAAGGEATIDAPLTLAYAHDGYLLADLHSHSVSSADAAISMEDRVTGHAALGVQVHFGTDHDRMSDYRPLVTAMGVDDALVSVVSEEFSPTMRGHFNVYPIDPDPSAPDNGSWRWWADLRPTTSEMLGFLRERHGDVLIQANHPTDLGVAIRSGWQPGSYSRPEKWTTDYESVEVMNGGDWADYLPFWWDLLLRGKLTAPVGVSDSHTHFGGQVGLSVTFLGADVDEPAALTSDDIRDGLRARNTVASRGPFLALDPAPGSTVAPGTTLTVEARSPSWIVVDRLILYKDGAELERVDGTTATFTLDADADAAFVVIAEGDTPMRPVTGTTPWALASAILVDVDQDGWTPPLPPMVAR